MRKRYKGYCKECNKYYEGEGRKFCSLECSKIYRKKNPKLLKRFIKKCLFCNNDFKTRDKRQKFCCFKCSLYNMQKNRIKIRKKIICKQCQKEFEILPSQKNRIFCSVKCSGKSVTKIKRKYNNHHRSINLNIKYRMIVKRAKKLNISYCSQNDFINWYDNTPKICEYCNLPEEIWERLFYGEQHHFSLTIDRKDTNDGYIPQNMTFACGRCNTIKSKWLEYNEMKEIGNKYLKPKWQNKIKEEVVNALS